MASDEIEKARMIKEGEDIQMDEQPVTPEPEDDESDFDGCDVEITDETPDEALPETEGGVA